MTHLSIVLIALLGFAAHAADPEHQWGQWRGPHATGVAPHADPPVRWSPTQNVRWKTPLPGRGHSSPVVWDGVVYITAAVPVGPVFPPSPDPAPGAHDNLLVSQAQRYEVVALDARTGETRWRRTVKEAIPHEGQHRSGSHASSSPVTDGEHVVAFFASHGLHGLTTAGELVWSVDLGVMTSKHGHGDGASPVLHGDMVAITWDHEGASFVAAFDKATGKQRWRVAREEPTSWSTPIVVEHEGRAQLVVNGTHRIRGYDLATGAEIWQAGGLTDNVVASPVSADGMVYAGSSYQKKSMVAVRLSGARGDLTGSDHIVWSRTRRTPYVPSPLLYGDSLYFLAHYQGVFTRVIAKTGEEPGAPIRLEGLFSIYASPVGAAGRIYVTDLEGTTAVLTRGPSPKVLALNSLGEGVAASAAVVGDAIYLRGEHHLWCLAK